jgi:glycosyltransferase involved in cell wall biosynthesis
MTNFDNNNLEALYNGAWMTFYPSLAEGYGFPIAEALSRGKVFLAAPSGGVREIDEKLIDFIDPTDPQGVAKKVMTDLSDPARLKRREEQIRWNYRSTDWAKTLCAVRSVLEATMVGCEAMHCASRKRVASVESDNEVQGSF